MYCFFSCLWTRCDFALTFLLYVSMSSPDPLQKQYHSIGDACCRYMGVVDPKAGTVGTVCHGMSYGCGAAQWGSALHEEECESTEQYTEYNS